jgi:hypothetical protein
MHVLKIVIAFFFTVAHAVAAENALRFDGSWNVTLDCPPHNDGDSLAVGYTHRFPGEVTNGQLRAVHGSEGEPNWHLLSGTIAENGDAKLLFEGIVGDLGGMNGAKPGRPYRYSVQAHFESLSGTGDRLTGRICRFEFMRKTSK